MRSEDVALLIAAAGDSGMACLVFCIGGPYGHAEAVRARANDSIRLSALVLNHQVRRRISGLRWLTSIWAWVS